MQNANAKNWKRDDDFGAAKSVRNDGATVFAVYKWRPFRKPVVIGWNAQIPGRKVSDIYATSRANAIDYVETFFPA